MTIYRPGSHLIIPGARVSQPGGAAVPWYLSGGIAAANCLAAYTPKGAASLAASYDNNAAPGNGLADGTYDATPAAAPTHAPATGWTFNGIDQSLQSGVVATETTSVIVLATAVVATGDTYFFGNSGLVGICFQLFVRSVPLQSRMGFGNAISVGMAGNSNPGNYALCGNQSYYNGTASTASGVWAGSDGSKLRIAARNAGYVGFCQCTIAAFAIYNVILAPAQVTALVAAMAAL